MMTLKESHFSLGLICHNRAITFFEVAFETSTIFSHFTCSQRSREFKSYREIAVLEKNRIESKIKFDPIASVVADQGCLLQMHSATCNIILCQIK